MSKIFKTESEWREILSVDEYDVLRKKGTDRAFANKYDKHYEKGIYLCKGCANLLFNSDNKFDSGSGWPSFWKPIRSDSILYIEEIETSRVEVVCSKCDGHLGHVFNDGYNTPTGKRYCINSTSLFFKTL